MNTTTSHNLAALGARLDTDGAHTEINTKDRQRTLAVVQKTWLGYAATVFVRGQPPTTLPPREFHDDAVDDALAPFLAALHNGERT